MRLISLLALLLTAQVCIATDRNAATCSFSDVGTAYTAAVDGDRVLIPAGSCTWNNTLTVAKAVTILGAGAGSLTPGSSSTGSDTVMVGAQFTVTVPDGKGWSIGGFRTSGTAGFNVTGSSKSGRIHHVYFDTVTGFAQNRLIWIEPSGTTCTSYSAGLVDHVTFYAPASIQFHVRESGPGGGNCSYKRPLDLGGSDAWYLEDSTAWHTVASYNTSDPVSDCDGGGRMVIRHNLLHRTYTEMHDAIIGGLRSCRKWETYENTFEGDADPQFGLTGIRGGIGIVFNNVYQANTSDGAEGFTFANSEILMALYRTYQADTDPWDVLCSTSSGKACLNGTTPPQGCTSDSQCGGQAGSCITLDGPTTGTISGYQCRDQVGADGNSPQFSTPSLFWNNHYAANVSGRANQQIPPYVTPGSNNNANLYIVEGRDYCVGPTTSSSDDATQPTTCNGRAVPYTPYTYPHPLQSGSVAPKAPTNLTTP